MTTLPALFPHQEEAAIRIARGEPTYLGFDMGIGKSRTAIEAANRRGCRRVLVLCPSSARYVWRREITRWAPGSLFTFVDKPQQLSVPARFTIISHGLMSQRDGAVAKALAGGPEYDMTVLDEAHAFNGPNTIRLKALKRALPKLGQLVPLSGTPIRNHAGDLYNILSVCWPEGLKLQNGGYMDRFDFENMFCRVVERIFNGHRVRVVEGSRNIDVLRKRVAPFMLRVKKEDVLEDLPPIIWDQVTVPLYSNEALQLLGALDHYGWVEAMGALRALEDPEQQDAILERLDKDVHLMKVRRLLGVAKLRGACEYLVEQLDSLPPDRKILVFAVHREVIYKLTEHLGEYNPAVITGETSPKDRDAAVEKFLTLPGCRVFIGNIQAAGTALTLVSPECKCSNVFFVESSWTSADNAQAACRVHRIGQKDGVTATMLMADHELDDIVHAILLRKAQEFSQLFDTNQEVTQ